MKLPDEDTISVEEVAKILGISRSVAYNAVKNGQIPSLTFSVKRIRIPVSALKKMLETGVQKEGETRIR